MSSLSVSQIQNTSSPTTNIIVNADGSVTLGVYRSAGVPPSPAQVGTLWYNQSGAGLVVWDGAAWVSPGGAGGVPTFSGGTTGLTPSTPTSGAVTLSGVLGVANGGTGATTSAAALTSLLPSQAGNTGKVLSTDGTTPSWIPVGAPIQAGLGINLSGTSPNEVYKLDVPIQFGPPPAGLLPPEAIPGSLYWDDNLGLLFIRYDDGSSTQWVQVTPVTPTPTGFSGSLLLQSGQTVTVVNGLITTVV
jgi:hypothetical protein